MENAPAKKNLLAQWKNREKKESVQRTIPKAPEGTDIPMTSGQQRLWFLQRLLPDNPVYNYPESFVFRGRLNIDALRAALQCVVNDNSILRSTYHFEDGKTIQKIHEQCSVALKTYDLSGLSQDEKEKQKMDVLMSDAKQEFNLVETPLLRTTLIKMDGSEHVLLLTMHHIIFDKWSMDLFMTELASHYKAHSSQYSLNEKHKTDLQFSDYAYWQKNRELDLSQLAYWKEKLGGDIPLLELPTDFPLPPQPSYRGASYRSKFSKELSERVLNLAKQMETTPYVLLLSVYYLLLHKYSGQEDILIGSPISNRDEKALEKIIGFFDETIVLRTEISSDMTFIKLVKEVRKTVLDAFSNKSVPFEVLVKEISPKRSLSSNPFFRVMFIYHAVKETPSFGNDLTLSHSFFNPGVSKFDLTLYVGNDDGVLSSGFEYATDIFEESTIVRLQEHLTILLEGVTADPGKKIVDIPMLNAHEKDFFYEQAPMTKEYFGEYTGIHQVIENIANKYPHKSAVAYKDETITYKTLNKRAEVLASLILQRTERRNEIVGICTERSIDMIVGLLGILKAGCGYLPIDPNYPIDRLNFMLADAECNIIVTQTALNGLFDEAEKRILNVDSLEERQILASEQLPKVKDDDIAYVIYTSGSTGKPKGVPISHKNIISSTEARLAFYPNSPEAFLLMSSISFDSSKAGIFWTLSTGGKLVITENRIEQDINQVENIIRDQKVSHTLMLPSLYKLILEHGTLSKLSSLKAVIVAGEACMPSLVEKHFEKLTKLAFYNEYGPTEATVWCIAHRIKKKDSLSIVPIGKAISNSKIYLLNDNLKMVPYGAVGEIYIASEGLSKGYINRPELSEKVFVKNPFSEVLDEKIYKTGDLGRFRNDGTIEFLGRSDHQVKIRGFRIELEEVENAITADTNIIDVVAMVEKPAEFQNRGVFHDYNDASAMSAYLGEHLTDAELESLFNDFEASEEEREISFSESDQGTN